MLFRHNIDEGIFTIYEYIDRYSAYFVKSGIDEKTGKINPIKPESRMKKYYFNEMRQE